jgi:hypothetical protein
MNDQPLRAEANDMDFNPATYEYVYQGKPFTGEMYEYDTEGTVKAISEFWDGVRHGTSRAYWTDGKVQSEARYRYGRPVGVDRTWYHNGQLEEEITYTDNGDWVSTSRWNARLDRQHRRGIAAALTAATRLGRPGVCALRRRATGSRRTSRHPAAGSRGSNCAA